MKKIYKGVIAALLIGVLAFGLTACGNGGTDTGNSGEQTAASQEKEQAKEKKDKKDKKEKEEKKEEKQKASDKKTSSSGGTCTISIECKSLLSIKGELDASVASQVPSSGVILSTTKVKIKKGDTLFDIIKRVTRKKGIHMAYQGTTQFGTAYVEGINNIYEKDGGSESGWKYKVNGSYPSKGCSAVKVRDGDVIVWTYSLTA